MPTRASAGLYLESPTTGEMGSLGFPKLPICILAILIAELTSLAFHSLQSGSGAGRIGLEKYFCSFRRVGLRLLAMRMRERRESLSVVEVGDKESALEIGLMGIWTDIPTLLVL